jgi:hypothetical protein
MSYVDPYVSPQPPIFQAKVVDQPLGLWRQGNTLVLRNGVILPPRCLKSNEPTESRWNRTLSWHPPWVMVLIFVALLIYVIVALILTKRATFQFPISARFRAKRRNALLVGWGLALAGVVSFFASFALLDSDFEAVGAVMLIGGLILPIVGAVWGIYCGRLLWPTQIDDYFTWLSGVCPEYLATLPDWPGPYIAFQQMQHGKY